MPFWLDESNEIGEVKAMKRYSLVLPEELYLHVQTIAEAKQMTVIDLFRQFIKLGLILAHAENDPDTAIILRDGERERELVLT